MTRARGGTADAGRRSTSCSPAHGIDDRVTRRMVSHLQPVLGNGQAGVARRDDSEDQWQRAARSCAGWTRNAAATAWPATTRG